MFSFFKKNKVDIKSTTTGSHGKHWYGIFDHATDEETLKNHFITALNTGIQYQPNNKIIVVDDPFTRSIVYKDQVVTGFPYVKGSLYYTLDVKTIIEWSHSDCLEAVIQTIHRDQYGLSFFAIDYAFHKDIYKNNSDLSVNLVGFAYYLEEFDIEAANKKLGGRLQFNENFCCYMPVGEEIDEIYITGRIQHIKEFNSSNIRGYMVTIGISDNLNLEVFIAQTNARTNIEINKHVCGLVWLQGNVEKGN